MSMLINSQEDFSRVNRQIWGEIFGLMIQKGRENKGSSVEEAARLAGMDPSIWLSVEGGQVPETAAQLRSMAGALELRKVQVGTMVLLCGDAWGK